jgi:hypothetical protein
MRLRLLKKKQKNRSRLKPGRSCVFKYSGGRSGQKDPFLQSENADPYLLSDTEGRFPLLSNWSK